MDSLCDIFLPKLMFYKNNFQPLKIVNKFKKIIISTRFHHTNFGKKSNNEFTVQVDIYLIFSR